MTTTVGVPFFALFVLMILGAFLALFIYSVVAKKHWLTILMLVVPTGLMVVLSVSFIGFQRAERLEPAERDNTTLGVVPYDAEQDKLSRVATHQEASAISFSDERWHNAAADIYPGIASCGRPLAFKIAEEIRREKKNEKKFAVTFAKEKHPGDLTQWEPPKDFVTYFQFEFMRQFPGSTVAAKGTKAEPASESLMPLEIKLSLKPLTNQSDDIPAAGAISARWTTSNNTRALASTDFVDKPWVVDPDKYKNSGLPLVVGSSQRLARSPSEATRLALEHVNQHRNNSPIRATPNQIVDRFVQKLSMPYGELWQESVMIDLQMEPNTNATVALDGEYRDLVPLVHNWEGDQPAAAASHGNQRVQHPHSRQGTAVAATTSRSRGGGLTPGLILTAIGLIAIGLFSNLLTQGYYRQNIKHTVITGVIALFGLLLLVLLVA